MLPATTMILFHNHQSFVNQAVCQSHVKTSNRPIRIISPWLRTFQQMPTYCIIQVWELSTLWTWIKLLHLWNTTLIFACINLCILSFCCLIVNLYWSTAFFQHLLKEVVLLLWPLNSHVKSKSSLLLLKWTNIVVYKVKSLLALHSAFLV